MATNWVWKSINAPHAWKIWAGAAAKEEVVVAVIDKGFDLDHPDLKDQLWVNAADEHGWDFVEGDAVPNNIDDSDYHGTFVAGLVGTTSVSPELVNGMAPNVRLMLIRAWKDGESLTPLNLAKAIEYAVSNKAEIISISNHVTSDLPRLRTAVETAETDGILVVAAVPNDPWDLNSTSPARFLPPGMYDFANIVLVTGLEVNDGLESQIYAAGSISVDMASPSVGVVGPAPSNHYRVKHGASFGTPIVAGAAALLLGMMPESTAKEVRELILANAKTVKPFNPSREWGYTDPATINGALDLSSVGDAYSDYVDAQLKAELYDAIDRLIHTFPFPTPIPIPPFLPTPELPTGPILYLFHPSNRTS